MTPFLSNRDIYTSVICALVPQVRERKAYFGAANLTGAGIAPIWCCESD